MYDQASKQASKLASVLCAIEYDRLGVKEYRKKRAIETEDQSNNKSEQNQMSDDDGRLKVIETFKVLVCSVLAFGMDHINNLKVKDLRVIICYHFGSEN